MDIKDLNKSQLIMLAILLSFVVSIATGITTVTLMEQAPSSVTVPINRVVQQTVEKIQQVEGKTNTVVVKEEDLVVDAIAKNQPAIFTLSKEIFQSGIVEVPAGRALAISSSGIVVADALIAPGQENYYLKNASGKFKADFIVKDPGGFSLLKIGAPVDGQSKLVYTPSTLGDLSKMKAGQKVIVLGNNITSFIFDGDKDIKLSSVSRADAGSAVLNLDGEVLGIALGGDVATFAPVDAIKSALSKIGKTTTSN